MPKLVVVYILNGGPKRHFEVVDLVTIWPVNDLTRQFLVITKAPDRLKSHFNSRRFHTHFHSNRSRIIKTVSLELLVSQLISISNKCSVPTQDLW
ncbi:unnamed protein product [Ambrosiozyma monospora]|uniref:Unnamed protein product n=1 Tax=Ambrosiozyma monospora TaxID=43982 RepID=A0ACB5TRS3_AMBMO|nr:unnamed protein product [Ambrosiozyma monospora]